MSTRRLPRSGAVLFHSTDSNEWITPDRRYRVWHNGDGYTECENDHVMRITREMAAQARQCPADAWSRQILSALAQGKRGYICSAGTEHALPLVWDVWDGQIDDYLGREATRAGTFAEACAVLDAHLVTVIDRSARHD
jgi:hypothetical protein